MKTNQIKTKDNLFYTIFYNLFNISFLYFIRRKTILGREDLPVGEAYLITPNHQNAMMDAMAILFTTKHPHPFFLARADIFSQKVIGFLLQKLKMLPIFRIRDGKDSLQNNDAIFKKTANVLSQGVPLTIYPEGNHAAGRRFRNVKKGVVRTAFMALENFPEGKPLYIVPTGIEYNTSYEKAMQNVIVYYGKPICVNDFLDLYKEDKARGERQLQLAIFDRMSDQMIDIKTEDYYDFYDIAREVSCGMVMQKKGVKRDPEQLLRSQIEIVKALDVVLEKDETPFADLQKKALDLRLQMQKAKLRYWLFDQKTYSKGQLFLEIMAAIITFPIALYGRLTNGLQYMIANHKAAQNKDTQWRSSTRYVMGFTLLPISHLIMGCATFFIFDDGWTYIAAVLSFIISGKFTLHYEIWLKKIMGRLRYNQLRQQPTATFRKIEALRKDINVFVLRAL